jgi:hypothetical protein
MTWLLWRQHRMQMLIAGIGVGALAILLAATRPAGLASYSPRPAIENVVTLTIAVPLLLGLFWGVTAVGRELDTGTHLLAWTQSVTKREWLRGKIIVTLTAAALWGAVLTALVTWWSGPVNAAHQNRFDPSRFDVQGIVPIAYAVFGAALGLAVGAVLRRLLPALAVTLAAFVAVRLLMLSYVRPHFATPLTITGPFGPTPDLPSGSWVLSQGALLHGKAFNGQVNVPRTCENSEDRITQCLADMGLKSVAKYQPASRYWSFQWIESGIFIALAAVLIVVTVLVVRRRDA